MTKENLLKSIKTYREIFNFIDENINMSNKDIMDKYFSFEYTRSSANDIINSESLVIRNKEAFDELPSELKDFYSLQK
jgi:hypothetical protein